MFTHTLFKLLLALVYLFRTYDRLFFEVVKGSQGWSSFPTSLDISDYCKARS